MHAWKKKENKNESKLFSVLFFAYNKIIITMIMIIIKIFEGNRHMEWNHNGIVKQGMLVWNITKHDST